MSSPKILVIRGGAIGDFILTLPAIGLLREHIPSGHLEILGYKPILELAVAAGLADTTRHLEHATMAKLFAPGAELDESVITYFRSFNLVVSYLYDPDGCFRGSMERIGVKTFLEASHRVEPGKGHATRQLAKPLERLAMYLEDPAPVLDFGPRLALPTARPVVVVHPGSGSLKKNWPVEKWIATGHHLATEHPGFQLALVTGEAEHERGTTQAILDGWRGLDFLHWDQISLVDLARRLQASSVFVGHDSGIAHLAAAAGLPSLLLFGPTDPELWAPRNPGVQVLKEETGDLASMEISQVWAGIARLLRSV